VSLRTDVYGFIRGMQRGSYDLKGGMGRNATFRAMLTYLL